MPEIEVVFYKERSGEVPALEFMKSMPHSAQLKLLARVKRLKQLGHELRRPEADYLRDGIYELRMKYGHVNYRLLYFFHGRALAVVASAMTKEDRVPAAEIERAMAKKALFLKNPEKHSYRMSGESES